MPDLRAIAKVVLIALACGAALAGTNWLTGERIQFNEAAALREAVAALLPEAADVPALPPEVDRVPGAWALCSGHLLARSNVDGYAGDIRLLYTLLLEPGEPRLVRLTVLGHQETPGIADFLTDPSWLSDLHDRDIAGIEGLSAVSGATITSTALREHLAAVLRAPAELLGTPTEAECGQ